MKRKRQNKILELIERYEIGTQEELAQRLSDAGFAVTQATVSRDIREMKLSKVPANGGGQKYIYIHREDAYLGDKYSRVLKEGFSSMGMASSILVVKTVSGMAMAVAASLDALRMDEIVGTIAGDDTIMMAIRTPDDAETVMHKIEEMIGYVN